MPVHNGRRYLAAALDSVVASGAVPGEGIEVVVVDDSSKDDSVALIQDYSPLLNLTLLRNPEQRGWIASTNTGLRAARGEFSCFLHQDDLWLENRLAVLRRVTQEIPRLTLFLGAARFADTDGKLLGTWNCPLDPSAAVDGRDLRRRLLVQNFVAICAPVFRTQLALDLGGLFPDLWYTADWDFWLRLATRYKSFAYDPTTTVAFRLHGAAQTVRRSAYSSEFRDQLQTVLHRHLRDEDEVATVRAAFLSMEINVALARWSHGESLPLLRLVRWAVRAGLSGLRTYLANARLWQRLAPRVRLRLRRKL